MPTTTTGLMTAASVISKKVFGKKEEYELQFNHEEDGNWYVDFPHWPFGHEELMMVAGADDLCAHLSDDGKFTYVKVRPSDEKLDLPGYGELVQVRCSTTGGSTYKVNGIEGFDEDIWICPVTLFVLGRFPKFFYVKKYPKNAEGTPGDGSSTCSDDASKKDGIKDDTKDGSKDENAKTTVTDIYNLIIVDESGSMCSLREATLSGINEVLGTIRQAQEEFKDTQCQYVTLVTFDSPGKKGKAVRTIIDKKPIAVVGDFRDYLPNGCTPLYDAMGKSLTELKQHVGDNVNTSVVVTVLTDGLENSSCEWNASSLCQLIEQLKEMGWSFSYMGSAHNVKEVTDLLHIDNVVEFSHDDIGTRSTWDREMSSRRSYYRKMSTIQKDMDRMSEEEFLMEKKKMARSYYSDRVTPEKIERLAPDEVFVFGSNAAGRHAGAAAKFAMDHFGAVWGQGEGLQGQSYAIPTMEGIPSLREAVDRFITFARQNPDLRFLVTKIGCGVAGYEPRQIAPLFKECIKLENVALPIEFWAVLGLRMIPDSLKGNNQK